VSAKVKFVVIGGVSVVLHGAPTTTQDLDIVHEQSEENIERLFGMLEQHNALVPS